MDVQTDVLVALLAIVGMGVAWHFRDHENSRVRASARGALVTGTIILVGLLWQWIRG